MATITVAPTTDRRAARTARPASPTLASGAGCFQRFLPPRRLVRRSRDRTESQDNIVDERAGSLPTVPAHAREPPPAPQLTPAATEPQPAKELDSAPRPQPTMESTPTRERTPTLESAPAPERPSPSNTTAGDPALTTPASALGDPLGPSAHPSSRTQVQRSTSSSPSQSGARMAELWEEAIKQYEKESKRKLSALEADDLVLNSKTAIEEYIRRNCEQSGAKKPVDYFLPVATTIENLCESLGNIASAAFPPASAIFSAIGILVGATISVKEDFQTACSAFETMDFHLQVIGSTANVEMDDTLRKVSVRILAQILAIFGVITKLRRGARIKTWLQRLCDTSSRVSAAMQVLDELTKQEELSMSAATLNKTDKVLTALKDAFVDGAQEHAHAHMFVECIASTAQKTCDVGEANRGWLEKFQETLLDRSDMGRLITDDRLDRVMQWLQFPNPSSRLNTLLEDRLASTGSWFLDGPDFSAFKKATRRHLVVHGKAFCGKSTLMAAAVRDLRASCLLAGMDTVVLVHLFDAVSPMQQEQKLASLLSSLLCQLALEHSGALAKLAQFQSHHAKGRSDPPLDSMRTYLHDILEKVMPTTRVYIVVDGGPDKAASDIASFLKEMYAITNVSLLISLRTATELHKPLDSIFHDSAQITMETQVTRDIVMLLDSRFSAGGALAKARKEDEQQIRNIVLHRADGNFLWAKLLLQDLESVVESPSLISLQLETVPETVDELYAKGLRSIAAVDQKTARHLLMWAVLSHGNFSKEEFARLLCFDYSSEPPQYRFQRNSAEAAVNLVGSTFLCINENTVRLVHQSIKTHLLKTHDDSFRIERKQCYRVMALAALAFVKAEAHTSGDRLSWSWATYITKAGEEHFNTLSREVTAVFRGADSCASPSDLSTALLAASQSGHLELVRLLINELGADVHAVSKVKGRDQWTPLHYAACFGNRDVAALLLDHNALVNKLDFVGMTPLHYAASHGQTSTVELLLSRGADVNGAAAKDSWCALHYAADKGHLDVIKVLVSAGADVNSRAADWQTPLHRAAKMVHPKAIRLLCKLRANQDALEKFGRSPLRLAIHWREEDSVEVLMKARRCPFSAHDADVEFQGSGKWASVPDDLARDTRIRDMLQRQWPKEEGGLEDHDTLMMSVSSYAHDFGGSPLIPSMLLFLIILLLLNLIHGLY